MQNQNEKKPALRDSLATDLSTGYDSTEKLPSRLESYSKLKTRTMQFIDWGLDGGITDFTPKQKRMWRNLQNCGQYLIFRQYLTQKISRLIGACSCKEHLLCAFCASRRGVKNSVAYKEKVEHLKLLNKHQTLFLVTYTIQNGADLFERFMHLKNSMRELMKRRTNFKARPTIRNCEFAKFNGGVMAYEFKRGSGGNEWHPHIHMLCLANTNEMLLHNELKREWLEITGDSHVINIELVRDDSAFLEVFAYALKFSEMEHSDRWYAFNALKGERLISSFGDLRGVEVDDSPVDEFADNEQPWVDLIYHYAEGRGYDNGRVIGEYRPNFDLAA